VRELGIDRAEARKILEDLVGMGLVMISKGMIQPVGGVENP
jgi:predicted transcriptional regulator